jgi:hypothetical protein
MSIAIARDVYRFSVKISSKTDQLKRYYLLVPIAMSINCISVALVCVSLLILQIV